MSSSLTRNFPIVLGEKPESLNSAPSSDHSEITEKAPSSCSDEFLVSRLCQGDTDALAPLFHRYSRVVRSIAFRILRDSFEADELVQEVFLQLQRKRSEFDAVRGTARVWILQIARNLAASRWRHLNSRRFYSRVDLEAADVSSSDGRNNWNGPVTVEHGFEKANLRQLFLFLSENQRRTLELFFCEGYTLDEIATEMGQSKGNIRHHYFRGLEKLRKEVFSRKPQPSAV